MSEWKKKLSEEQIQALKQLQGKVKRIHSELNDLYYKTLTTLEIDDHGYVFDFVFHCSPDPKDRYTKLVANILRDGY